MPASQLETNTNRLVYGIVMDAFSELGERDLDTQYQDRKTLWATPNLRVQYFPPGEGFNRAQVEVYGERRFEKQGGTDNLDFASSIWLQVAQAIATKKGVTFDGGIFFTRPYVLPQEEQLGEAEKRDVRKEIMSRMKGVFRAQGQLAVAIEKEIERLSSL